MLASPRYSGRQGFPVAKTNGFTLVELLTVVAIILILAGIVVGVQRGVYSRQANAKAKGEIHAIATALEQYKATYGTYPHITSNSPTELFRHLTGQAYMKRDGSNWTTQTVAAGRGKPFIDADRMTVNSKTSPTELRDPWGRAYIYVYNPNAAFGEYFFILYSQGATEDGETISSPAEFGSASTFFAPNKAKRQDNIVFGLEN